MEVIYLCGPINGCTDNEAIDWREQAKKVLGDGFSYMDPMRRDYRGRELERNIAEEIVNGDKEDIDNSSILLVFAPKPSVGTSMEIIYGWERFKKIIIVHPGPNPSPWLIHHSDQIFSTFEEAFKYILALTR